MRFHDCRLGDQRWYPRSLGVVLGGSCQIRGQSGGAQKRCLMAHSCQHLASQRDITNVLAQVHRISEMSTSGSAIAHVVGHPPGQLVELGNRCGQLPAQAVAVPAITQQRGYLGAQVVGDS
jgi:hypothetical protein